MRTEMYVVYDKIAQESGQLFHAKNDAVAARSYAKQLRQQERPEDFQLLKIGSFDHDTARASMLEVPEEIFVSVRPQAPEVSE